MVSVATRTRMRQLSSSRNDPEVQNVLWRLPLDSERPSVDPIPGSVNSRRVLSKFISRLHPHSLIEHLDRITAFRSGCMDKWYGE
ncbi:hypothetical protein B0H12DRAFT_284621 [Mycena haematopus]|nr:hypothetical protein B0H12DRAFT_284621 [Mycena haematopus]